MFISRLFLAALFAASVSAPAMAEEYTLTIKDHKFDPAELVLPAGQRIELLVKNEDATPEEFESNDLKREKIISGNSQGVVKLGPLKPGSYAFFGDFHQKTARGTIIVK